MVARIGPHLALGPGAVPLFARRDLVAPVVAALINVRGVRRGVRSRGALLYPAKKSARTGTAPVSAPLLLLRSLAPLGCPRQRNTGATRVGRGSDSPRSRWPTTHSHKHKHRPQIQPRARRPVLQSFGEAHAYSHASAPWSRNRFRPGYGMPKRCPTGRPYESNAFRLSGRKPSRAWDRIGVGICAFCSWLLLNGPAGGCAIAWSGSRCFPFPPM